MVDRMDRRNSRGKQTEAEEKIRFLRRQSPKESFESFLVLSDFYCQVFLDSLREKENVSEKKILIKAKKILEGKRQEKLAAYAAMIQQFRK